MRNASWQGWQGFEGIKELLVALSSVLHRRIEELVWSSFFRRCLYLELVRLVGEERVSAQGVPVPLSDRASYGVPRLVYRPYGGQSLSGSGPLTGPLTGPQAPTPQRVSAVGPGPVRIGQASKAQTIVVNDGVLLLATRSDWAGGP